MTSNTHKNRNAARKIERRDSKIRSSRRATNTMTSNVMPKSEGLRWTLNELHNLTAAKLLELLVNTRVTQDAAQKYEGRELLSRFRVLKARARLTAEELFFSASVRRPQRARRCSRGTCSTRRSSLRPRRCSDSRGRRCDASRRACSCDRSPCGSARMCWR